MNLEGAKIFITGGSSGLGKAMASMLKDAGANIVISGRDKTKLEQVGEELGVQTIVLDQSNFSTLKEKCQSVIDMLDGIDVLINNAGTGWRKALGEITLDDFRQIYDTNVIGLTLLTQEFLPTMKKQSSGHIINIASTAAMRGYATGSVYSSSKFALRSLSECWRAELRKHNIRVMIVNPSEVPTAFAQEGRKERPLEPGKLTPDEIAHTVKSILEMDNRGFIPEVTVWATNP